MALILLFIGCSDDQQINKSGKAYLFETGKDGETSDNPRYVLRIPKEYSEAPAIKSTYRKFKFLFPGMDPVSTDHHGWLTQANGKKYTKVRVLLRHYGKERIKENDYGQFFYDVKYDELIRSGLREPVQTEALPLSMDNAKCYERNGTDRFGCAFSRTERGYGYLTCDSIHCDVRTTWKRKFSVRYQFSRDFVGQLIEIDKAASRMIDDFRPERIGAGSD